ncbi:tetratricopeptide repeat protein [Candidatus Nitrospira salsa]
MYWIYIVASLLMSPMLSYASSCSEFEWHYPSEMAEPEMFRRAQQSMVDGELVVARELFLKFLQEQPEGVFAEGAQYAVASLPNPEDVPDAKVLAMIKRLFAQRKEHPQSPYAPWALCRVGELFDQMGWALESNGVFEEFLSTYPDHPLAGGVLLNAGINFLEEKKYIEASLVFRRLVQEPKWTQYHLEGALGLADATAFSHAWDQAYYWYQVVDVEQPQLIRSSAASAYHYGLSIAQVGNPGQAMKWYLTTYNLHPEKIEAGFALNNIAQYLLERDHEMAALWFFQEASLRYPQREPGRRGHAALTRWVFSYLGSDHSQEAWKTLYDRLNALEIYLSVSWDGVVESSRELAQAPEADVADEAQFWLAKGYQEIGDEGGGLAAYRQLLLFGQTEPWKTNAQNILTLKVSQTFQSHYQQQQWVELIRYYEQQQLLVRSLPQNLEWMRMLAEAYRQIGLSKEALKWYDNMLKENPTKKIKEQILSTQVILAHELGEIDRIRQAAKAYIQAYPKGQFRDDIFLTLGRVDVSEQKFTKAITQFTQVIERGADNQKQQMARIERAHTYEALGKFGLAIEDYRYVLEHHPTSIGAQLSLADLLYEQKRYAEAENLYQAIGESEAVVEVKTWAQFRLALCFQETGKQAAATPLLDRLRQPGQNDAELESTIRAAASAVLDEYHRTSNAS